MPGPKQLQKELEISQQDWQKLAVACDINLKKKSLSDDEAEKARSGIELIKEGVVSNYNELAQYFKNPSSPKSNNLIQNLVEEAVKNGTTTGELYTRVFQESAQRRFQETLNSGELQHNLAQGFQNILFNNGLTAEQLENQGMRMVQQISDSYEPNFLQSNHQPNEVKMISGNLNDLSEPEIKPEDVIRNLDNDEPEENSDELEDSQQSEPNDMPDDLADLPKIPFDEYEDNSSEGNQEDSAESGQDGNDDESEVETVYCD